MAHLQKCDSDRSIFKKKLLKNFSCLHDEQQERKLKKIYLEKLVQPCESEEWVMRSLEGWLGGGDALSEGNKQYIKVRRIVEDSRKHCTFLKNDMHARKMRSFELSKQKIELLRSIEASRKCQKHKKLVTNTCLFIVHDFIHMSVVMSAVKEMYDGMIPRHRRDDLFELFSSDQVPLISISRLSPCFNLRIQQYYNHYLEGRMYWSGRAVEESDEASQDGPSSVWKVFDGVFRSLHEWTYLCNHFNISKDMNVALTGPPFAKTSLCAQHVSAEYNFATVNLLQCMHDLVNSNPACLFHEFRRFQQRLRHGEVIGQRDLVRYLLFLIQPAILSKCICLQTGNKDESEGYVLEDFPRTSSHLELLKREVDEFLRTKSLQVFNSLLLKKPTISSETSEMPTNWRVSSAAESVHQARQSVNSMKGSSHLASAGVLPGECAKKQLHDFFTSFMHLDVPYKSLVTNIHNLKNQDPVHYLKALSWHTHDTEWQKAHKSLDRSVQVFQLEDLQEDCMAPQVDRILDDMFKTLLMKRGEEAGKKMAEAAAYAEEAQAAKSNDLQGAAQSQTTLASTEEPLKGRSGLDVINAGLPHHLPKRAGWVTLGNWWVMEECYSLNSKSLLADLRVTEDEVLRCLSCARQNFRWFIHRPNIIENSLIYYRQVLGNFIEASCMDAGVRGEGHERLAEMRAKVWQVLEDIHSMNLQERCQYIGEEAWRNYGGAVVLCYAGLVENEVNKSKVVASLLRDVVQLARKEETQETFVEYQSILERVSKGLPRTPVEALTNTFNPFNFHRFSSSKDGIKENVCYIDKVSKEAVQELEQLSSALVAGGGREDESKESSKRKTKRESATPKKKKKKGVNAGSAGDHAGSAGDHAGSAGDHAGPVSNDATFEDNCRAALTEEIKQAKVKIARIQGNYRRLVLCIESLMVESFNQFADWSYRLYLSRLLGINSCFEAADLLIENLKEAPNPVLEHNLCLNCLSFTHFSTLMQELRYIAPRGTMTLESFYESLLTLSLNKDLITLNLLAPFSNKMATMSTDPLVDWRRMLWMACGCCPKVDSKKLQYALCLFKVYDQFSSGYLSKEQFTMAVAKAALLGKSVESREEQECRWMLEEQTFELYCKEQEEEEGGCDRKYFYPALSYYAFLLELCCDCEGKKGLKKALSFYTQIIRQGEKENTRHIVTANELKQTLYPTACSKTSKRRFQKAQSVKSLREELVDNMLEEIQDTHGYVDWKELTKHNVFQTLVKYNNSYHCLTDFKIFKFIPQCLERKNS